MIAALQELRGRFRDEFVVNVVDVDEYPALEAKWGDKVPVLLDGETEICHYFLDVERLAQQLGNAEKPA